ncbi:spore coat protein [Priestia megaterium]|jgi:spore coat protein X|uniref:spore coat protein n=1 Tax=Priestia megaterium TaxID=1404 RepID=UPI0012D8A9E0|nr:spore coat protein [Priestia megaterium]MUL34255.1 Spore coat protein X [Priestia megaterium]QSX24023.1 spore coat protein [Priestia megaterium]
MPSHKHYESREVKKRSKKKYSDHDYKSRFELEEDDHFSHLFESDNNFEHENNDDAVIEQEPDAFSFINQDSDELIWIKDSCDIDVTTVDTQIAAQVQTAIQTAIGVITATLVGNIDGQVIAQELLASANLDQVNKQKIIIVNSKDVTITAADTDIGVNIQVALQTLTAVVTAILVGNVSGG